MSSKMKPFRTTSDVAVDIFLHIYNECPENFTYSAFFGDNFQIKCNRTGDTIVWGLWSFRDPDSCLIAFHKDFL
jgi:hypothetical protein